MTPEFSGMKPIVDAACRQQRVKNRRDNSEEKPDECECCGFETEELIAYPFPFMFSDLDTTHQWACAFCNDTRASHANAHPENYRDPQMLKAICYIGNAIIAEIRKGRDLK